MIAGTPAADDEEVAALHHAEEHEEARRIAGTVDAGRPQDHPVEALAYDFVEGELPFPLRLLIVVLGSDRRVLVGRRVHDVAVNAFGRAIDDSAHAGTMRLLRDDARTLHVHAPVDGLRHVDLTERGGDVLHDLHAFDRLANRFAIGDRAELDLRTRSRELVEEHAPLVVEYADGMSAREVASNGVASRESRAARDEHPHRPCLLA